MALGRHPASLVRRGRAMARSAELAIADFGSATPSLASSAPAVPGAGCSQSVASSAHAAPAPDFSAYVTAMRMASRKQRFDRALLLLHQRHAEFPPAALDLPPWGAVTSDKQQKNKVASPQPMLTVPASSTPLVALLASHISSAARARRLRQCLASIAQQEATHPTALLVSISARDSNLLQDARTALAEFKVANRGRIQVHCLVHSNRRSQFEHLAALVPALRRLARGEALQDFVSVGDDSITEADASSIGKADLQNAANEGDIDSFWLVFTDDDDIWHSCRTLVYRAAIAEAAKRRMKSLEGIASSLPRAPVAVPIYAMNTEEISECDDHDDVESFLRSGRIGLIKYTAKEAAERAFLEFWLHCIPARVLLDFVDCTPHTTLAHSLCDVRFATFIRDHAGAPTFYYTPPGPTGALVWMYFHRQHDSQVTSGLNRAAEVSQRDLEVAERLRRQLGAGQPARPPVDFIESEQPIADLTAQFVAEIRRDVEMLVLYGQVAVEDIVHAALMRQQLVGTPDAPIWAQVAAELAEAAVPVLAPPTMAAAAAEELAAAVQATSGERHKCADASDKSVATPGQSWFNACGELKKLKQEVGQTPPAQKPAAVGQAVVGGFWVPGGGDVRRTAYASTSDASPLREAAPLSPGSEAEVWELVS